MRHVKSIMHALAAVARRKRCGELVAGMPIMSTLSVV
jgi:hypothetical protein